MSVRREVRELPYVGRAIFKPYHLRQQRFSIGVAHRRCGKTVASLNDLIIRALNCRLPDGRYGYLGPLATQAKETAWLYLQRFTEGFSTEKNEAELWIQLPNRARIRIYGADNPDRLRGGYFDGAVLDEFGDMRPSLWGEVVRPMLSDRQGWASFIGTPKGRNHFWQLYNRALDEPETWFTFMLKASETGILPEEELESAKREQTPEQYAQEYECSFDAAILGAYFGREIAEAEREGRIRPLEADPEVPVHTVWDLGVRQATAIWWFQVHHGGVWVVDHYEATGHGAPHFAKVVLSKPYKLGNNYFPHDVKVKEWGSEKTRLESVIACGLVPSLVRDHEVEDGINAAKLTIPRCLFDSSRCAEGLEALRQYRTEYDERTRAFKSTPRPDWTCHTADAFRYLAMAYRELDPPPQAKPPMRTLHDATLDELWASHRKSKTDPRRI
jgi:hypothetical protein